MRKGELVWGMEWVNSKECGRAPWNSCAVCGLHRVVGHGGEVGTLTSTLDAPLLVQTPPAPLHVPEWTLLSESSSHEGKCC